MAGSRAPSKKARLFTGLLAALPLGALCLAGCLLHPSLRGGFSTDAWETWTSWNDDYGSHSASADELTYSLSDNQNDTRDMPIDGLMPGLLLSRPLPAAAWTVEVSADFPSMPGGSPKRFTFGIWLGEEQARPSIDSPSSRLKLLVQRRGGDEKNPPPLEVSAPPLRSAPSLIPASARTFRFRREGANFSVYYTVDGSEYRRAITVASEAAAAAPAARFFIGGRSEGPADGAKARLRGFRINGR